MQVLEFLRFSMLQSDGYGMVLSLYRVNPFVRLRRLCLSSSLLSYLG